MAGIESENLAVVRRLLDALMRADVDEFLGCLTPDIEWDDREGWPGGQQIFRGHAGVRQWLETVIGEGGRVLDVEIEDLSEAPGSRALLGVLGTFRGRSTGIDTEFKARSWYVFSLRDGKISRARLFWLRREALEAAGLPESDRGAR